MLILSYTTGKKDKKKKKAPKHVAERKWLFAVSDGMDLLSLMCSLGKLKRRAALFAKNSRLSACLQLELWRGGFLPFISLSPTRLLWTRGD